MLKKIKISAANKIIVNVGSKISSVLNQLNSSKYKTIFIQDKNKRLVGTITDGDLRRGFIKGVSLNENLEAITNINPFFLFDSEMKKKDPNKLNGFLKKKIKKLMIIPILNNKKKIKYFFEFQANIEKNNDDIFPVVIMAGGKGKRLYPLTSNLPKALVKHKGKPMIEIIIENFSLIGFKNFIFSLGYFSEKILAYLNNLNKLNKFDVKIDHVIEKKPLGTCGSLYLIKKKLKSDFILINCDVILELDFNRLVDFHKKRRSDLTIVTKILKDKSSYGLLNSRGFKVSSIAEKITDIKKINVGLYVISLKLLNLIKKPSYLDMSDFINLVIKKKYKALTFPIYENWTDLGIKKNLIINV